MPRKADHRVDDARGLLRSDLHGGCGKPYRLWIRGKATRDAWTNDSVFVQFDQSVTATGTAVFQIGTTSATIYTLEDCSGCGLAGWGWQDNGYGTGVLGPAIYFARSGPQRLRVQVREDGLGIDQIVLSARTYLSRPPGATRNDTTILTMPGGANVPPTVSVTTPTSGSTFTAPATIAVIANATDPDGAVAKVEFFAGATSLGVSTAPPYSVTWQNVPAGQYSLTAVATDSKVRGRGRQP